MKDSKGRTWHWATAYLKNVKPYLSETLGMGLKPIASHITAYP